MDDAIADVVHISRATHEKFMKLGADEEFRQLILNQGICIHLIFDQKVEVLFETSVGLVKTDGPTLASAVHTLIKELRGNFTPEFRTEVIKRFQEECPHAQGYYLKSHGHNKVCNVCHKEWLN